MFCIKCGKEIKGDSNFCVHCGAKVHSSQTLPKQKEGRKMWFVIMLISVSVLLVGTVIVYGILHGKGNRAEVDKEEVVMEKSEETTAEKIKETDDKKSTWLREIEEEGVKISELTKEECQQIVSDLYTESTCDNYMKETLLQLTQIAVSSKVCDSEGTIFAKMADEKKERLGNTIMMGMYSYDILEGQLELSANRMYSRKEAEPLLKDLYGCEAITYLDVESGEDLVQWEDYYGGPWLRLFSGRMRENDDYYLFSGSYYYGYNGIENDVFEGYIDVLFVKNEESRFGVTMLYAKTDTEPKVVTSVKTSSALDAQEGNTYLGTNLIDGNIKTAWVEGVDGVGVGERVTLRLQKKEEVHGLQFWNGYFASAELYDKNGKVNRVNIDFGNGVTIQKEISASESILLMEGMDIREYAQFIELDEPVMTDTITITIIGAEAGDKYDDTCIGEIQVY